MKYIMFEVKLSSSISVSVPIIFPSSLIHRHVVSSVLPTLRVTYRDKNVRLVSAGFYDTISGDCSGKSETLNIECNKGDKEIILSYEYAHGLKFNEGDES